MPPYTYKAIDASGRKVRGVMEAQNAADLENRLERLGIELIRARPARLLLPTRALPRRDLIQLCFHLEQLSRAGVPMNEALGDLADSLEAGRLRDSVAGLLESINGGRTLSAAMDEQPAAFPEILRNLIRAGERSGRLPEVCQQLIEALKTEDEMASFARRLTLYPAFILLVIVAALVVSLVYLVPQLTSLFASLGQQLPLSTRIMLGASSALKNHGHFFLIAIALVVIALRVQLARNPRVAQAFDRLLLRLPGLGPVLKKILLARFLSAFSLMYGAGIAITESLAACRGLSRNRVLHEAIDQSLDAISRGVHLSAAVAQSGLFPPLVIRMLRVGETSGALAASLANVNYFFERDVREAVARAQAMLEPALTLLLGLMLMWVMLSVLGPVYDILVRVKI